MTSEIYKGDGRQPEEIGFDVYDINELASKPELNTTLHNMAIETLTDKWRNCYTDYYAKWFESVRYEEFKILEIGVERGYSIRLWNKYFPNSTIYGVDNGRICNKSTMESLNECDGIVTDYLDQSNREDLQKFIDKHGGDFDIIIDDGFHYQEHQQISFGFLFPYLKPGGVYIIEDVIIPSEKFKNVSKSKRWGIEDNVNFTDATLNVLLNFISTGKLDNSPYMTKEEKEYIEENTTRDMHELCVRVMIKGSSAVATINKRGKHPLNNMIMKHHLPERDPFLTENTDGLDYFFYQGYQFEEDE